MTVNTSANIEEEEDIKVGATTGGLAFMMFVIFVATIASAIMLAFVGMDYITQTYVEPIRIQNEATRSALQQHNYCEAARTQLFELRRERNDWWSERAQLKGEILKYQTNPLRPEQGLSQQRQSWTPEDFHRYLEVARESPLIETEDFAAGFFVRIRIPAMLQ